MLFTVFEFGIKVTPLFKYKNFRPLKLEIVKNSAVKFKIFQKSVPNQSKWEIIPQKMANRFQRKRS